MHTDTSAPEAQYSQLMVFVAVKPNAHATAKTALILRIVSGLLWAIVTLSLVPLPRVMSGSSTNSETLPPIR